MEREITYTLKKEFVYAGTGGKEKVSPGTLMVPRDKYSYEMHGFYNALCEVYTAQGSVEMRPRFKFITKVKHLADLDLRKYPITYLESDVCVYGRTNHVFYYMAKEIYFNVKSNFYRPLFFVGHSS